MTHQLTFFDFKRKHGLGHSDIQKIIHCTLQDSKNWTQGTPVPPYILDMINAIDVVIDRIKTDNGIFTDVDAQHAAHIIEGLNKEIAALKVEIADLKDDLVFMLEEREAIHPVFESDEYKKYMKLAKEMKEKGAGLGHYINHDPSQEVEVTILHAEAELME